MSLVSHINTPCLQWWVLDVYERAGHLYKHGLRGRPSKFGRVANFGIHAQRARSHIRNGLMHIPMRIIKQAGEQLWHGGYGLMNDDMDLQEWAFYRLEWLEFVFSACGYRTIELLCSGLCPIPEPPEVGIYYLPLEGGLFPREAT